jgi:hypothetical protein
MPVFEVGLDDGRKLRIEADDQEAALAGVAHFQSQEGAKAPSGFAAGLVHGAQELVHGDAETAKDFYGVGKGYEPTDKGYVPANVTNGSINPLNWNYSQIPQKIAEQAPGLGQDIVAASAGSKLAPGGSKAKPCWPSWWRSVRVAPHGWRHRERRPPSIAQGTPMLNRRRATSRKAVLPLLLRRLLGASRLASFPARTRLALWAHKARSTAQEVPRDHRDRRRRQWRFRRCHAGRHQLGTDKIIRSRAHA